MKYKYYDGKTLEECIDKAQADLNIPRDELKYEIKKKGGLIRKKCEIEVEYENEINILGENRNSIKIEDNKIILDIDDKEILTINTKPFIKVFVNDIEADSGTTVTKEDKITYSFISEEPNRNIDIYISKNEMEAKADISYISSKKYELNCNILSDILFIDANVVDEDFMPFYTRNEIMEKLKEKNIKYGIQEENLNLLTSSRNISEVIIAKGDPVVDDEMDTVDFKFANKQRTIDEDSIKKIDYRNLYSMTNVLKGDVIAEIIKGRDGTDGRTVKGLEIKKKSRKPLALKLCEGCEMHDNKVIATIDGRPSIKNGVISVKKVYTVNNDIDIKTGNISFVGDVCINGNVKSGMEIKSGNSVDISGNIESSNIIAEGQIDIKGSIIGSTISAGGTDFNLSKYVENLIDFKENIEKLISAYKDLDNRGTFKTDVSIGEVIKILLENKFKNIPKKAMRILVSTASSDENELKIKNFIRTKIIGSGPLSIKYLSEMYDFINCIDLELEPLKDQIIIPVDVNFKYSQDSNITATGNIIVSGKGEYGSDLCSGNSIVFLGNGAVARGGTLNAKNSIKIKTAGSLAGVTTVLTVSKKGIITAEVAYQNTVFVFGERKYLLDAASKNVKAYMDEKGEIVVEKFKI